MKALFGLVPLLAACSHSPSTPPPAQPVEAPVEPPSAGNEADASSSEPTPSDESLARADAPCRPPSAPKAATFTSDVAVAALPRTNAVQGATGGISRVPVFGGSIAQHARLAVGKHERLRIPADALVAEGAKAGTIEVYVTKSLGFAGHPPEPMSAASVRHNMGLATTDDGTTLVLATYGEFDTRIEGGAAMQVFVRVPKGLPVETHDPLSGDDSEAARWPNDEASYRASEAGRVGYWYAPVNPRKGWSRVKLQDDPRRVAAQAGEYPSLPPLCRRIEGPSDATGAR